ncbi:MAG: 4-hydroxy-tetrahydrodipicolinate reductase [Clostridia bacterium]|nr:4-hydroxy-tetrahydrodipicolinate reductase [Clostridia bacterium]
MRILLCGARGYMGKEIVKLCEAGFRGATLAAGIDPSEGEEDFRIFSSAKEVEGVEADVIVDFSHHTAAAEITELAAGLGIPAVVATTGHTEAELDAIYRAARSIPVFFAANMSVGVALLCELAKKAAAAFPDADIEIVERHHTRKLDAPSGTALTLAKEICEVRPEAYISTGRSGRSVRDKNEIGIQSVRIGNVVGDHEIQIATEAETITLKHEAHSRSLFAQGALSAASFIIGKSAGIYGMKDMLAKEAVEVGVK